MQLLDTLIVQDCIIILLLERYVRDIHLRPHTADVIHNESENHTSLNNTKNL